MNGMSKIGIFSLFALVLAANSVKAETIYVRDGDGADARVRNYVEYRGYNYGDEETVTIGGVSHQEEKAYLRFDLRERIPEGEIIDTATLRIYWGTSASFDVGLYGLNDAVDGDQAPGDGGWEEMSIIWADAPGNWSGYPFNSTTTTSIGTFTKPATWGSAYMSNVELVDFLNTDTNGLVTLMLNTPATAERYSFFSKETSSSWWDQAFLEITTVTPQVIPEPASLCVFIATGLMMLGRRKCK